MDDAVKTAIGLFGFPGYGHGFNRLRCWNSTNVMLQSHNPAAILLSQDSQYFFSNDSSDPQLTLYGCNHLCGSKNGLYPDTPIRLLIWFIPAILLVTNIQFEPLEKSVIFAMIHLFGNPIEFIWTSLARVKEWSQCRDLAKKLFQSRRKLSRKSAQIHVKDMATILSAMRELILEPDDNLHLNKNANCPCIQDKLQPLYHELAIEIIDSKLHGTFRTIFSIILYIFGVISSFFEALGGSKTPSGTILFPAAFLSWMLPAILLNNVVGQFRSPRDCSRIIWKLEEEIFLRQGRHSGTCFLSIGSIEKQTPWGQYIETRRKGASSFTYKRDYPSITRKVIRHHLVYLAFVPVGLSFSIAFYVLWSPPTNFTCRHYILIFAFVAWLLSPMATIAITHMCSTKSPSRFIWILIKDFFIGVPIMILLVASACGLFNTCWCWSGINVKGHRVVLNPEAAFANNDKKRYPETMSITLLMQLLIFLVMLWQGGKGFSIMKRSSKEKEEALPRGIVEMLPSRRQVLDRIQVGPLDRQRSGNKMSRVTQREIRVVAQDDPIESV